MGIFVFYNIQNITFWIGDLQLPCASPFDYSLLRLFCKLQLSLRDVTIEYSFTSSAYSLALTGSVKISMRSSI